MAQKFEEPVRESERIEILKQRNKSECNGTERTHEIQKVTTFEET